MTADNVFSDNNPLDGGTSNCVALSLKRVSLM